MPNLIILGLTLLKDGEQMNPPLKKRVVIDSVTIGIFWAVFEFLDKSGSTTYKNEIVFVINASLFFFFARMIQLICQVNPMIQELVQYLKSKGVDMEDKEK
ncbi:Putative phage holin [Lactococcus piscium MKFS47]|uniref:Putative phage holin n=1 Tax=Pseudolactococcus piscium MKFS47 TaxID=297352 RepID=A0A0D6DZA6_9LACT|nr:holin [Lactococcus piscium]CEN29121.1 Putative phage holin [Lactococcus piscium MKFS47]